MKIGILIDSFRLPLREAMRKAAAMQVSGVQCYANAEILNGDRAGKLSGRVNQPRYLRRMFSRFFRESSASSKSSLR